MDLVAVLAPHTPDLLSSFRTGVDRPLLEAFQAFQAWLSKDRIPLRAIIAFTPGWQTRNIILVDNRKDLESSVDYAGFGVELRFDPPGDPEISGLIMDALRAERIPIAPGVHGIDHAISVPLFFLTPDASVPVVPISQPLNQTRYVRVLGQSLRRMSPKGHGRILVLMSGVYSQNEKIMARGIEDPLLDPYLAALERILEGAEVPDPLAISREMIDRADPPGRLREIHLLNGLGVSGGHVWGKERLLGLAQYLVSFGPFEMGGLS